MLTLLAVTDLSSRSDRALHRAALLAAELHAQLVFLHVIDDDQPSSVVEPEMRQAERILNKQALDLTEQAATRPVVLVKAGNPFELIVKTAQEQQADLVVMGAHRKHILRDVFVGTTIERVMRTGRTPVLMVNAYPTGPYRRALLAVDISEASARAAHVAKGLGFLRSASVAILHAFRPYAKSMLGYVGAHQDAITRHVVQTAREAATELNQFLDREGLAGDRYGVALEEGDAFETIATAIERQNIDLLVIGTRGHTGLKRLLLGSVADEILRQVECDVLAVPPN
jgi:nucleotide-binding universal stress UspA family protein